MKRVLPIIVISQFLCTSLWFAGNAILPDIAGRFALPGSFLAHLTSAVQFGFISGTLLFALFTLSDRFSPSKVFFGSAMIAAGCNLAINFAGNNTALLLSSRFLTGFFLAGIYPVGMKIASDHYQRGLGRSLGFLVGALVLGTALPHLLRTMISNFPWSYVIYATSLLAVVGGSLMLLLVPDGPYRKAAQQLKIGSFLSGFGNRSFRSAALGYFGHMWELYAFWAFVPVMLGAYKAAHPQTVLNIPLLSFGVIAVGGLACVVSGLLSKRFAPKRIAAACLCLSGTCCLLSPFLLLGSPLFLFIGFLFFWGLVVVGDSPMFSTIVAQHAPEASRGTALTIVNCIGFSITIASIQFIGAVSTVNNVKYIYMLLAIGPVLGLLALMRNVKEKIKD